MAAKARDEFEKRKVESADSPTKESVGEYSNYDSELMSNRRGVVANGYRFNATGAVLFGVNFPWSMILGM